MVVTTWTDVVVGSLENLWVGFVNYVPRIVGALVVLVIGIVVAAGLGALVEKIFDGIRLDRFLEKIGLRPYFERAGVKLRGAYFLGRLVYWFIVIAFLLAASDSLGLYALSGFLGSVLNYLPNVIAAILILLAAFVLANFLRRVVLASVMGAKLGSAHFLSALTWWAVVVFGLLAALSQLNIAEAIIQDLVMGVVAMFALAGGLAFGLGGRDYASYLIDKLRDRVEPK